MRTYYLYALMDPNLNIPKYIGITNNPDERLKHHINDKSAKEAAKELNGSASFITSVANGSKNSAYGYIWKYTKAV